MWRMTLERVDVICARVPAIITKILGQDDETW